MPQLLIILLLGLTALWIVGRLSGGRPLSAAVVRQAAGGGLIFLGGFLALRGGIAAAAPFLALGLGLLGKNLPLGDIFGFGRKTKGQKSRVQTRMLAMELDHDSGAMDGEVLEGEFKGRRLSELNRESLLALLRACRRVADQSGPLLEAYLDRTVRDWRAAAGEQRRSGGTANGHHDTAGGLRGAGPQGRSQPRGHPGCPPPTHETAPSRSRRLGLSCRKNQPSEGHAPRRLTSTLRSERQTAHAVLGELPAGFLRRFFIEAEEAGAIERRFALAHGDSVRGLLP